MHTRLLSILSILALSCTLVAHAAPPDDHSHLKQSPREGAQQRASAFAFNQQVNSQMAWMKDSMAKMESELIAKYGEGQRERLRRGLQQVASFWREGDGGAAAFEGFVRTNFAGDQVTLDTVFKRFERNFEQLDGHMHEIAREFNNQSDLDVGPILPFDEAFAGYDASAHILDDFFQNKLAFIVLLNFPLTTLEQRLTEGEKWSRREWAERRLA